MTGPERAAVVLQAVGAVMSVVAVGLLASAVWGLLAAGVVLFVAGFMFERDA